MGKHDKILAKLLSGTADANIAFADLVNLLASRAFLIRHGGGSHVIATREGVRDRITLQPDRSKEKKLPSASDSQCISEPPRPASMKDSRYEMIVYWDKTDGIFVVEVPELPGCMAHGLTKASALRNTEKAIKLWLSTAKEDGIIVPEPRGRLTYA